MEMVGQLCVEINKKAPVVRSIRLVIRFYQKKEPQQKGDQATAQYPSTAAANATFARSHTSLAGF